jgi:ribosomal protein L37AE/L43A
MAKVVKLVSTERRRCPRCGATVDQVDNYYERDGTGCWWCEKCERLKRQQCVERGDVLAHLVAARRGFEITVTHMESGEVMSRWKDFDYVQYQAHADGVSVRGVKRHIYLDEEDGESP